MFCIGYKTAEPKSDRNAAVRACEDLIKRINTSAKQFLMLTSILSLHRLFKKYMYLKNTDYNMLFLLCQVKMAAIKKIY